MSIDVKLTQDTTTGVFDISLENGDLKTINSFDTSITVGLFADKRAVSSEVVRPELRRGWWGNQFSDNFPTFEIGSKLWLLDQERKTQSTLNKAIDYARNAMQWLVTDGYADKVDVTGAFTPNGIGLTINIYRDASIVESRYYDLWENSGQV